MQIFLGWL